MNQSLRPVVVVTGGSEGIGLAIALRFAALGRDLLLVARRELVLEAAAAQIRAAHPVRVDILSLDLTVGDAAARIEAALAGGEAYAEIIVNNAGIGLCGSFADQGSSDIDRLLALNITALTRIIRHFAPGMQARRRGGFINVASLGGYAPGPQQAVYYASKAYVVSLSEALAHELRPYGVRVTVIAPGPVETKFHDRMGAETALYRRLLPSPRASTVARWAVHGYSLGMIVVLPGLLTFVAFATLRLLPHRILVPAIGFLLRPRGIGR